MDKQSDSSPWITARNTEATEQPDWNVVEIQGFQIDRGAAVFLTEIDHQVVVGTALEIVEGWGHHHLETKGRFVQSCKRSVVVDGVIDRLPLLDVDKLRDTNPRMPGSIIDQGYFPPKSCP